MFVENRIDQVVQLRLHTVYCVVAANEIENYIYI